MIRSAADKTTIKTACTRLLTVMCLLLAICRLAAPASAAPLSPESSSTEITVDFRINSHKIEENFSTNPESLKRLRSLLKETRGNSTVTLDSICVWAFASPDGRLDSNRRLSLRRMVAMRDYLVEVLEVDPDLIVARNSTVPWDYFRQQLKVRPFKGSDRVLEIISEGSDGVMADNTRRMEKLKHLDGGRVWDILCKEYLPEMRVACTLTIATHRPMSPLTPPATEVLPPTLALREISPDEAQAADMPWRCDGAWHLRTSIPAWGAAVANVAGEYDFACRWSVALGVDYSGWNYGKVTRKFRTFRLRPEVRFWTMSGHKGFFIEAHASMIYYNVALPSWEYRIQDRDGRTPALGGGLGIGFRLPISRNGRWSLEAAVSAGAYSLDYDRFENRYNGPLVDSRKRFFFGIDNAAISLVYTINPYTKKR